MGLPLPGERQSTPRGPALWLLGVILPCMITSYGSYRSAKAEADAKAAAGYDTLKEAQKKLEQAFAEHLRADEKETSKLAGKLDTLEHMVDRLYELGQRSPAQRAQLARPIPAPKGVAAHFTPFKGVDLPETLDDAQRMVNAKK